MTRHSWLTILLAIVLVASSAAVAQPTAPPADTDTDSAETPTARTTARGGRHRANVQPLTDDQEAELLEALGSRFPHRREELLALKKEKPEIYVHVIARLWHWYEEWQRLPDEAKELAMQEQELNIQAVKLAREWHLAEGDDQQAIEEKLRDVLAKKFDVAQKLREVRLAAMQKQIEELRKENADRSKKRDEIIEEQLTRALTNPHGSRSRAPTDEQPVATDDDD